MVLHHLSIIVLFLSENSSYLCSFAKVLSSLKLKILCLCWVKYAFQLNAIAHKLQYGLRFLAKANSTLYPFTYNTCLSSRSRSKHKTLITLLLTETTPTLTWCIGCNPRQLIALNNIIHIPVVWICINYALNVYFSFPLFPTLAHLF